MSQLITKIEELIPKIEDIEHKYIKTEESKIYYECAIKSFKQTLPQILDLIASEIEKYTKQENYWDEMPDVNDFQKGALHSRNKMRDYLLNLLK